MNIISIGIDPGINGAIVALDNNFKILSYCDMPTAQLTKKSKGKKKNINELAPTSVKEVLSNMIKIITDCFKIPFKVILEYQHALPAQGISSTFKTGRGFGLLEGILVGLGYSYDIVHAKTWTKVMLRDVPIGEPKQRSLIKAQRLFGSTLSLTKPHGRILSYDGRADAALLAYYGMLQMLGSKEIAPIIRKMPVRKKT